MINYNRAHIERRIS